MTTRLPPGWYPDPDGKPEKLYWDGHQWYAAPPPKTAPPPKAAPPQPAVFQEHEPLFSIDRDKPSNPPPSPDEPSSDPGSISGLLRLTVFVLIVLFLVWVFTRESNDDKESKPNPPSATTTRSAAPEPMEYMRGDGTYEVGNVAYWGIWEATAPRQCNWSIREVSRYSGATVLDVGSAAPGQTTRVNIQPPPGGSYTVAFMTNGCGPWKWVE